MHCRLKDATDEKFMNVIKNRRLSCGRFIDAKSRLTHYEYRANCINTHTMSKQIKSHPEL